VPHDEDLTRLHSISCPRCGARSNVAVPIAATKPKTWTQECPVCCKPWKVKIWIRRGVPELIVEPGLDTDKPAKD
jgi:hypothetical protein